MTNTRDFGTEPMQSSQEDPYFEVQGIKNTIQKKDNKMGITLSVVIHKQPQNKGK